MQKNKTLLIAVTLIAVFAGTFLWLELRSERERSADLAQRIIELESQLAGPALPDILSPQPVVQSLPRDAAGPRATSEVSVAAALAPGLSGSVITAAADPDFCALQRSQARAQLPRQYPQLAAELSLSATEQQAFMDLLTSQRDRSPGNPCGTGPRGPASPEQLAAFEKSRQSEIAALLGPRYQLWQQYEGTLESRQRVNSLRERLAAGGSPLSDAQASALLATFSAEQERSDLEARGRGPVGTGPRAQLEQHEQDIKVLEQSNARIVASAAAYLSSAQMEAMKGPMEQRVRLERSYLEMQRAHADSGSSTPLPQLEFIGQ